MSQYSDSAKNKMEKCLHALDDNFTKVRTGRANPHILDGIQVEYYGQLTPIAQLAALKVPEANMLLVEPWDKSILNAIEKAISGSDLGITPTNDGQSLRLPFPAPTEERRKELVKECRALAEESRVAIRNVRREANGKIDRDEELSDDDKRQEQTQIQKLTDSYIGQIEDKLKVKTNEIMEI